MVAPNVIKFRLICSFVNVKVHESGFCGRSNVSYIIGTECHEEMGTFRKFVKKWKRDIHYLLAPAPAPAPAPRLLLLISIISKEPQVLSWPVPGPGPGPVPTDSEYPFSTF